MVGNQAQPPYSPPGETRFGYARSARATFARTAASSSRPRARCPRRLWSFRLADGSMASGGTAFDMPASGVLDLVRPVKKR
jgi:hypothetical protein